jgi:hypothetical protein
MEGRKMPPSGEAEIEKKPMPESAMSVLPPLTLSCARSPFVKGSDALLAVATYVVLATPESVSGKV